MTKVEKHEELCNMLHNTYLNKNSDYGDSFSQLYAEYGINYAMGHLKEKLYRLNSITKNPEDIRVKNESVCDTLLDLANYALLTYIEEAGTTDYTSSVSVNEYIANKGISTNLPVKPRTKVIDEE